MIKNIISMIHQKKSSDQHFLSIMNLMIILTADVIKKYSNFVGVPIYLNGKKINVIQVRDPSVLFKGHQKMPWKTTCAHSGENGVL